ncbi:MAG: hypothetical protein JSS66_02800 [Armatimonadetes bacterium]|nr:hypothetical protein [Armatimonadota bacterium]
MQRFLGLLKPLWQPHAGQSEFLTNQTKFKVLACGRRWGKTEVCAVQAVHALFRPFPTKHLVLAPTADQASLLFERVADLLTALLGLPGTEASGPPKIKRSPYPHLRFGPHTLMARSAHIPRSLRGHEATHIVVDEAAYLPESLITEVAMPMLATSNGYLTLISTPHGKNHFWRFFEMGRTGDHGVWSRQAPSEESPFVSQDFLAIQRELISERAFKVEYCAEFLDSCGQVFKTEAVDQCLVPDVGIGAPPFVVGVDWARYADYTAVVVLSGDRSSAKLLQAERFNSTTWIDAARRVAALIEPFGHATVLCDATGVGDAALENLRGFLPDRRIKGVKFNNTNKQEMIDNLVALIERGALQMRPDPVLLRELSYFQATETHSGRTRLGAIQGQHDDMVIALALAATQLNANYRPSIQIGKARNFSKSE